MVDVKPWRVWLIALAVSVTGGPIASGAPWFTGVGLVPGGASSEIRAVSADGTVAVGQASDGDGIDHLVVWTRGGGLGDAGVGVSFDFARGRGVGVDSNGTVHVAGYGQLTASGRSRAFHWSGNDDGGGGAYTTLPTFGGDESIARNLRIMTGGE